MAPADKKDKSQRFICLCNSVPQKDIEDAIARGCNTLGRIFDATTAGCGACGGSCQPILRKMLEAYEKTGKFLDNPRSLSPRRNVRRNK